MKRLVLALMLTGIIQISGYAVDDVWGGMGLTEEALQKDSNYANTIFDKYTNYSETPAPKVNNGNYPADLTDSKNTVSASDTEKRTISNIEFYGLNSVSKDELLSKMQMKSGETYSRDMLQSDLKAIYETGFFTENMKAIPSKNDDGTVTVKIVVEENLPVKDFTIEGNTVVPVEDILAILSDMKGKPQNITQLNAAIAQIQELYNSKGYILARVSSVNDDPDGTINITIKEGIIDKIMIEGNEKTKDYIIARNVMTEPGMIYNENLIKEDLVRLYATQAFKDVTREIEPSEDVPVF